MTKSQTQFVTIEAVIGLVTKAVLLAIVIGVFAVPPAINSALPAPTRVADDECAAYGELLASDHGGMIVVGASWCPACNRLEAKLRANDLPFVAVDVDRHPKTVRALGSPAQIPQVYILTRKHGLLRVRFEILDN